MVGSIWAFGVLLLIALIKVDSIAPAGRRIIKIEGHDSVCYYATAHSLLFDGDFDLTNQYAVLRPLRYKNRSSNLATTDVRPETGLPGSPFAIGFSILEIPFLLLGHLFDLATGGQSDGYSRACMTAFFGGIIFYLCLGMTFLFDLLRRIGYTLIGSHQQSDWISWGVTFGVWPTTSLAYYTFSPMAHVVAFMACSVFLLTWWRAKETTSNAKWLLCGLAGGLLALCRWEAALILCVPAFYELSHLIGMRRGSEPPKVAQWLRSRALFVAGFLLVMTPQLIQWKHIYGSYITVPQGGGFLEFPPRYILNVLFSTQHGWFIWTPITLLGITGLLICLRRMPAVSMALLIAIGLQVLVIGSQPENWHGTESFGNRLLTTLTPIVAIGVGIGLFLGSRLSRGGILVAGIVFAGFTMLFAVQYRADLVPKNDRLTFDELIVDKLFLRSAWNRRVACVQARRELENSNPQQAIALALNATGSLGADRELLRLLVEAYGETGDELNKEMIENKLKQTLDARLW